MTTRFDIAIAGGGPVGAALALALSANGYDVALVEPQAAPVPPGDAFDLRTYALSLASIALLARIDAWAGVARRRSHPYVRMRVWEDAPERELAFDAGLVGERELGHLVEDSVLRAALYERLDASRVTTIASRVVAFESDDRAARLTLEDGRTLTVALAIAADGGMSRLRALAGMDVEPSSRLDFAVQRAAGGTRATQIMSTPRGDRAPQRAVVANVRVEHDNERTAWQRFTPDGPLAFLPLSSQDCGVVWSVTAEKADALLALDDDAFRAALAEAFQWRLGDVLATSPRASFPLLPKLAARYVGPRVALVGDAAHTVLPLAGQGLNLGLLDVAALVESIGPNDPRRPIDAGDASKLLRYERWRAGDNALAANAFRALDAMFRANWAGLDGLRRFGLAAMNRATPLKRELAMIASGQSGRVPELAKRRS